LSRWIGIGRIAKRFQDPDRVVVVTTQERLNTVSGGCLRAGDSVRQQNDREQQVPNSMHARRPRQA
jgi:hypothetical protein